MPTAVERAGQAEKHITASIHLVVISIDKIADKPHYVNLSTTISRPSLKAAVKSENADSNRPRTACTVLTGSAAISRPVQVPSLFAIADGHTPAFPGHPAMHGHCLAASILFAIFRVV
jgi:hypothetical protein